MLSGTLACLAHSFLSLDLCVLGLTNDFFKHCARPSSILCLAEVTTLVEGAEGAEGVKGRVNAFLA